MFLFQTARRYILGSIQIKLGLTLLLVTSMVLSAFGLYNYLVAKKNFENDLNKSADALCARLSKNLSGALWNLDWQAVETSVEAEMSDRNVYSIRVNDITSRKKIGRTRDASWRIAPSNDSEPTSPINRSLPITRNGQNLGEVQVYFTTSLMESDLNRLVFDLFTVFVILSIVLLVTLFVALRFGLISPLLETKTILEKIGQGQFLKMLPAHLTTRVDEIGVLMQAIMRMQTDLREKIAALDDSQKQYATIFNSSPSAIAIRAFESDEYREVNTSFQEMFGYPPEEAMGKTPLQLNLFIEQAQYHQLNRELNVKRIVNGFEYRFRRKNGTEGLAIDSAVVIVLNDVPRVLSISHDITNLRRAEEEANRLSTAMESVGDAVVITDLEQNINYINPGCGKIFGLNRRDIIGQPTIPHFVVEGTASFPDIIKEASRSRNIWSGPITFLLNNGKQIFSDTTISPILTPTQKFLGCVSVIRDQSENRRLEAEIRHVQKMEATGALAGGVAHEFRNILTIIVAGLQITQMKYDGVRSGFDTLGEFVHKTVHEIDRLENNREHFLDLLEMASTGLNKYEKTIGTLSMIRDSLGRALTASRRATDLISQMLTFSRQNEQILGPLDPNVVLSETMKLLRPTTPSSISLRFEPSDEKLVVNSDPTQLQQILVNLINNAVQAMPDSGGEIIMGISKAHIAEGRIFGLDAGDYMKLSVSDNGPGIPPDIIDRIFDPFFTTKPKDQGTGLGLSVVHGIVKNHRGATEVRSTVGLGTTFDMYFPLVQSQPTANGDRHEAMTMEKQGRIVLVDDETEILANLAPLLMDCGHIVHTFTSPEAALAYISRDPEAVDIVLTDLTMPGITGIELIKQVKSISPGIRCILGTGSISTVLQSRADGIGADRLLEKPYMIRELSVVIQRVLSGRKPS